MLLARTVVVDASAIVEEGTVVVNGDRIVAVGARADLTDRYPNRERREFGIVTPGLVDGHVHSVQSLGRGITDDTEFLDRLFDCVLPMETGLDAEGVRAAAELGYLGCVEPSTTTVVDHLSVRHARETFETAGEMGVRGRIGKVLMNTNIPEGLQEDTGADLVESERLVERYHDSFDGHIQYTVTPRFAVTRSEAYLRDARDLVDRYDGVRIHTHASENRSEIETVEDETGMRNIHWLDKVGLTDDGIVLVHRVHTNDSERDVLTKTSTYITYRPSSDMKLASGIAPIPDCLDRGINVVLGNDGPSYNNTLGPFTKMRQAGLFQKVDALDPTSAPAATVFEMVTRNGAKVTGFNRVGELYEGWRADVVDISTDRTRVTPLHDVLSHLVFVAHGDDMVFTMVDGDVPYDEGEHVRADTDSVRKRARVVADGPDSAPTSDRTASPPIKPPRTRDRPAASTRPAAIVASFSPRDTT